MRISVFTFIVLTLLVKGACADVEIMGIDVYGGQGVIDWPQVAGAGYSFVFVKATEGEGWTGDSDARQGNFEANMQGASSAGMLAGAYHFARPDLGNSAADEASWFVDVAGDYIKPGYLRPVLDIEVDVGAFGSAALSSWVIEWMETIKSETGVEPLIYARASYANNYLEASLAQYDLWVAHYTYDPNLIPDTGFWDSWAFWQYSDSGQVPGISGNVDLDIFSGSASELSNFVIAVASTNGQETECLATAIMSEASIGTNEERVAVAWTIFNRVDSPSFPNTVCDVVYQGGQYATNQEPTQKILDLSTSLIDDRGTDPTGGATYFFSPISMPKEGDATRGYDVGGGLHEVTGIDENVYFPSWTLTMVPTGDIPGVRPAYYMFYQEEAANQEVELTEESNATASSSINTSIILLFDASSSMADEDKIDNAKEAAKNSIATLGSKDEVALIVFYDCSRITVEQPFTTDWSALAAMINTIRPTGGTPLYAAKDFAQAYMDENARGEVRRIILLTDGIETCGGGPE